ncbi:alpha/beta fold hydrolase [Trinickia caryophylli]|uniref:Pimeloyl-ACP methyl ester carboxylesterase n=1 Tax=Trinickia caryophylli TaxID=28094 RepID=A0A1X7CUI6_TRICW|nr:alpha/beta fold hydrolase [Trinickia caryophylli]PMS13389.1 alpha/beta hydrolase [Trinickia caryophylli]TRX13752.1 alpha/beta fold hydrolase [Trinickia caryophylli]WQE15345.1 alpha/beta fold hydrolase [Trinickia caryophylli]SMF03315.1 Pimeloyl-ACP methyl ester carboxylesterase [Trinickia caryophylli]GLU30895.1 hydrolase [Trinickia caryophylli]
MTSTVQTLRVSSRGLGLAVYVSGPCDAPPVVFVHGYPDSATVWNAVRSRLDARFRVIAYDVCGAGHSDAPRERRGYRLECLAQDLMAVAEATCGTRPFHLVGHDWGSVQSWEAVTAPELAGRIASFTSISGPCLDHALLSLREREGRPRHGRWKQMLRSAYIPFFHLPLLPEAFWRSIGARAWPFWLRRTEHLRVEADPLRVRNAVNGLELYRANFIERLRFPRPRQAQAAVQWIVPLRDHYVGPDLATSGERWVQTYVRAELDAGHWAILSHPGDVADAIRRFVSRCAQSDPKRSTVLSRHPARAAAHHPPISSKSP